MSGTEFHIASFVVRTRPEHDAALAAAINATEGLEVHGIQSGKLIVTAEADNVRTLADLTGTLQKTEHVLAVAPIYHEFTDEPDAPASRGVSVR